MGKTDVLQGSKSQKSESNLTLSNQETTEYVGELLEDSSTGYTTHRIIVGAAGSQSLVQHAYTPKRRGDGKGNLIAAALATTAAVKLLGEIVDEDDAFAGVGLLSNTLGGGGGGAGASLPAAQSAVLQQMAVGAAQNATASLASGTSAAAAGGAGGGAGAVVSTAANSSAAAPTAAVATVVTAVAAGIYAYNLEGEPLVCPNITDPDILRGSVSFDFVGVVERPNTTEAFGLATSFMKRYDDLFGCESLFSRSMINCSVPCFEEPSGNFSTQTRCCENYLDRIYGELVRCSFDCFVHCVGCPTEEPLFLVPEFTETGAPNVVPYPNVSDPRAVLDEVPSDQNCSPLCLMGNELKDSICTSNASCRVIQSTVYQKRMSTVSPAHNRTDVNKTDGTTTPNATVDRAASETITVGVAFRETFVPFPSSNPSQQPSVVPTISMVPSSQPSSLDVIATFVDEFGFTYGLVEGSTLSMSNIFNALTVRVDTPSNVQAVSFSLDSLDVYKDVQTPFFLAGDRAGYGTAYPRLLSMGHHTLMLTLYGEDQREIETRTMVYQVIP